MPRQGRLRITWISAVEPGSLTQIDPPEPARVPARGRSQHSLLSQGLCCFRSAQSFSTSRLGRSPCLLSVELLEEVFHG